MKYDFFALGSCASYKGSYDFCKEHANYWLTGGLENIIKTGKVKEMKHRGRAKERERERGSWTSWHDRKSLNWGKYQGDRFVGRHDPSMLISMVPDNDEDDDNKYLNHSKSH